MKIKNEVQDPHFEELPIHLKSKWNADISSQLCQRLNFLWKSANALVHNSRENSCSLSGEFIKLVQDNGVEIPSSILKRVCKFCCCILIPSLTCKTAIRDRGENNRKRKSYLGKTVREKKEILLVCEICHKISDKEISRRKVKRRSNLPKGDTDQTVQITMPKNPVSNKAFSFLDFKSRRKSAPGRLNTNADFIPLSGDMLPTEKRQYFSQLNSFPIYDNGDTEKSTDLFVLEKEQRKKRRMSEGVGRASMGSSASSTLQLSRRGTDTPLSTSQKFKGSLLQKSSSFMKLENKSIFPRTSLGGLQNIFSKSPR